MKTLIFFLAIFGFLGFIISPAFSYETNVAYHVDIIPDHRIDGLDLIALCLEFGHCDEEIENVRIDLDGNGCIDEDDLNILSDHFGFLVSHQRPPIAAFTYYWYAAGENNWSDAFIKPKLGYYSSQNVLNTLIQNEWKHNFGIDIDIISWDNGTAYENYQEGYEEAFNSSERTYFFLYETEIRLGPCQSIDLGTDENRTEDYTILLEDIRDMAVYDFWKPNYYTIQGRPVLMIWVTSCFKGDYCGAIQDIRHDVFNLIGKYPFIICDEYGFGGWEDQDRLERIRCSDGVSSYAFYNPYYADSYDNEMNEGYLEAMMEALSNWSQVTNTLSSVFTGEPVAIFLPAFPGFQVHGDFPPLYATVDQFRQQLDMVASLAATYKAKGIFISSFNEHFEDTAIEPSNERDFDRLKAVRSSFGLKEDYTEISQLSCSGPMVTIDDYEITKFECPNQQGRLPYNWVNWYQAATICSNSGTGYRLCSAQEWEDACDGVVGPGGSRYPYGDSYRSGICNDNKMYSGILPSGSLPDCVSPFGVYDMSGNIAEFTTDQYPNDQVRKMNKGGTWTEDEHKVTCQSYWKNTPDYSFPDYGFRCCRSLDNSN